MQATRRHRYAIAAMVVWLAAGVATTAACAQEEAARQQFVTSCGTCHTTEPGGPARQGPNLHGIYGHAAGQQPGFKYSEALKTSNLVFDDPTLDRWIENAQAVRPGVIMPYRQRDPAKRRLIIDYLKSVSQ